MRLLQSLHCDFHQSDLMGMQANTNKRPLCFDGPSIISVTKVELKKLKFEWLMDEETTCILTTRFEVES